MRRSLDHMLNGASIAELLNRAIDERRVLLLIDGLDEWSNEQAARTTLATLVATVQAHDVPVIVSGRPRGLNRIGALPADWKRGTVAPLSREQQTNIAGRWFARYAPTTSVDVVGSDASLRTGRFMAELARDANLGALAVVPLLLIGLVTLALRGQILPRTRGDIYDQLVRVLLEVHPESRATASGDTEPRFRYATDPDQRRAALARLAFSVRMQLGGAGMLQATAQEILRAYLASSEGFDLPDNEALSSAKEILFVNAETQGLIIEKAPGEIGFIHASFEEFLCAEHIGGWPLSEIEAFVEAHSGEGRWRNVITNLLGRIQRKDEFDRLVAIIEAPDSDDLASFNRQFLLGDIAYGTSMRATATVKRLAIATMRRVETEDWIPARREALASVLKGLPDPAFSAEIEQKLERWLPARFSYREPIIRAFESWQPSPQLQETLFQAMSDDGRGVQRAAAAAYAKVFANDVEACRRLLDGIARTRDLAAAAAMLESLALSWSTEPEVAPLFWEAWRSHSGDLKVVGILGLAQIGEHTDEMRESVLRGQSLWSDVSFSHRDLAAAMLRQYWPNDETLTRGALRRVSGDVSSHWEMDSAIAYLSSLRTCSEEVKEWILAELSQDHPFSVMGDYGVWEQVGRFSIADPQIRAAANAYWSEPKNRLISMYRLPGYVAQVADPMVANALIEELNGEKSSFNRYWALHSLLVGWGRDHPDVKPTIDALTNASDEDLYVLASMLPQILDDKVVARERLLRMSKNRDVRRDLIALGFEKCGCDANDDEAVAAILAFPDITRNVTDPSSVLFRTFGAHPRARAYARKRVGEVDGPLQAIIRGYSNDSEFAPILFAVALPLSVDLRAQIVEVAATGAAGTALERVLANAMLETDPELRVRMTIAHHRALSREDYGAARAALLTQMIAVGMDFKSTRAAALAGLVTIGAIEDLVALESNGKPMLLETSGNYLDGITSVERLICERYAEFEATFGADLSERFTPHGEGNRLTEILSAVPGASPAARAAFLAVAERGEMPCTPQALRALAGELPRSALLLERCWDALDLKNRGNDQAMIRAEIGLILREHFPNNETVRTQLIKRFRAAANTATAIPLAIYDPEAEELDLVKEIGVPNRFADWALAIQVAAHRADSVDFCEAVEVMLTRERCTEFDAQQISNQAIELRLQRDPHLVELMSKKLDASVDPSISGSFARYLAAAGKLSPEARVKTLELLRGFSANQSLPVAGYDAISDQWRAVRASLLDAVAAGLEVA
ncbi:hypothetical protein ACVW0Y_003765 [Pseudomonas sp. TE3786]